MNRLRLPLALAAATVVFGLATVLTWSGGGAAQSVAPAAAGTSDGAALFRAKGCATCHRGPDSQPPFDVGPDLRALTDVAATRELGVSAPDYVRRSIAAPDEFTVPGFARDGMGSMPTLAVTAEEADALVAYLLAPSG